MNQSSLDERKPVRQAKLPGAGNVVLRVEGVLCGEILVRRPGLNYLMQRNQHVSYHLQVGRGLLAGACFQAGSNGKNRQKTFQT
jgi:hypothetical protein